MKMWKINKRNLPNKLVPPGKNPKINKRTGTFIWHYRVLGLSNKVQFITQFLWKDIEN